MSSQYQPGLHRFAMITAVMALLPITVGALVTTMGAGMAFLDWPSSDGHNMFLYPWLQSLRQSPDKFVEHGHRLGGIVIGLVSIGLAVVFWIKESRNWARWLGVLVLALVCAQGWLGGQRVQLDLRGLAMLHGLFASWVFACIACVAVSTSKAWYEAVELKPGEGLLSAGISAVVTVVSIQLQYVLGGLLRHNGMVVHEHLGMAFIVVLVVMWNWVAAYGSEIRWLRRSATWLVFAILFQIGLGLAAFVAKYGFGEYVATQYSMFQMWSRTGHTVVGMFVWMFAVTHLLKVSRVMWVRHAGGSPNGLLSPSKLNPSDAGNSIVAPGMKTGATQ